MTIEFADHQIVGGRRYQEDSYRIMTDLHLSPGEVGHLFLLADGMGGHANGGVASELVCEHFLRAFTEAEGPVRRRLRSALMLANEALKSEADSRGDARGMGSTLVALWLSGSRAQWISVGDSALVLQRGDELTRLNADHSMAPVLQKMVELGQISQAEADTDSKRHALRSAISGGKIKLIDWPEQAFDLQPGDRLLLTSDGMDTLGSALTDILTQTRNLGCQQSLAALFAGLEPLATGDQDNTSAILIKPDIGEDSSIQKNSTNHKNSTINNDSTFDKDSTLVEDSTLPLPGLPSNSASSSFNATPMPRQSPEQVKLEEEAASSLRQNQQARKLLFLALVLMLMALLILGFLV